MDDSGSSTIFDNDPSPTSSLNDIDITGIITATASLTTSAYEIITTSLSSFPDLPGYGNSTSPFDPTDGEVGEGSYILVSYSLHQHVSANYS
jgi:hypothetical protein